jgi:hypothetical protein
VNHKRVYRLYSQASLAVPRRKKVKRPLLENSRQSTMKTVVLWRWRDAQSG